MCVYVRKQNIEKMEYGSGNDLWFYLRDRLFEVCRPVQFFFIHFAALFMRANEFSSNALGAALFLYQFFGGCTILFTILRNSVNFFIRKLLRKDSTMWKKMLDFFRRKLHIIPGILNWSTHTHSSNEKYQRILVRFCFFSFVSNFVFVLSHFCYAK